MLADAAARPSWQSLYNLDTPARLPYVLFMPHAVYLSAICFTKVTDVELGKELPRCKVTIQLWNTQNQCC